MHASRILWRLTMICGAVLIGFAMTTAQHKKLGKFLLDESVQRNWIGTPSTQFAILGWTKDNSAVRVYASRIMTQKMPKPVAVPTGCDVTYTVASGEYKVVHPQKVRYRETPQRKYVPPPRLDYERTDSNRDGVKDLRDALALVTVSPDGKRKPLPTGKLNIRSERTRGQDVLFRVLVSTKPNPDIQGTEELPAESAVFAYYTMSTSSKSPKLILADQPCSNRWAPPAYGWEGNGMILIRDESGAGQLFGTDGKRIDVKVERGAYVGYFDWDDHGLVLIRNEEGNGQLYHKSNGKRIELQIEPRAIFEWLSDQILLVKESWRKVAADTKVIDLATDRVTNICGGLDPDLRSNVDWDEVRFISGAQTILLPLMNHMKMVITDIEGKHATVVTTPGPVSFRVHEFSDDRTRLALRMEDNQTNVAILNIKTGTVKTVTTPGPVSSMSMSSDGRMIALAYDFESAVRLTVRNAE